MADADMAEGVENAFVRQHAVGERDLVADVGEIVWHGKFLILDCVMKGECRGGRSKAETKRIAKRNAPTRGRPQRVGVCANAPLLAERLAERA